MSMKQKFWKDNCNHDGLWVCARCGAQVNQSELISMAMQELENASMGGIGTDGPTIMELDECAKKGRAWKNNQDYHTMQRAWRILESEVKP